MKVKVVFFTHFRQITGLKETELELPEQATVTNLFEELSNRFGERATKYLYNESTGKPRGYLLHFLDEKSQFSSNKKDLNTKLKDGEKFAMVSPAGGG